MYPHQPIRLLRQPAVCERSGHKRSYLYVLIKEGLFPPPLKQGRISAWIEQEIEAVLAARVSGKSEGEIRDLIACLVAERKQSFDEYMGRIAKNERATGSPTVSAQ